VQKVATMYWFTGDDSVVCPSMSVMVTTHQNLILWQWSDEIDGNTLEQRWEPESDVVDQQLV